MPETSRGVFEFGPFRLDSAERILLRTGQLVPLTPKAFDLLVYLVEHQGRLVEKSTLMAALWPDTIVEEANLAFQVSALRKALGDGADGEALIQTVPTKGYRFVGAVRTAANAAVSEGPEAEAKPESLDGRGAEGDWKRWLTVGVAALAIVALVVGWRTMHSPAELPVSHATAGKFTRVTFDPGLQTDVTWAPDGRSIAYAADKSGNFDIWVQRLDSGEALQITKSPAQDRQPTWSPDGSTIVFRSERDGGGLFAVPAGGGAERRITTSGFRPEWAPDGFQILFGSTDVLGPGGSTRLHTVQLDGSPPHEVLSPFLSERHPAAAGGPRTVSVADGPGTPIRTESRYLRSNPKGSSASLRCLSRVDHPTWLKVPPDVIPWGRFEWADAGRTAYLVRGEAVGSTAWN